jgi:hypothetical protein
MGFLNDVYKKIDKGVGGGILPGGYKPTLTTPGQISLTPAPEPTSQYPVSIGPTKTGNQPVGGISRDGVSISFGGGKAPTIETGKPGFESKPGPGSGTAPTSRGNSSRGGSSSYTPYTPVQAAPNTIAEQEAQQKKDLSLTNQINERAAKQSDTNYLIATKSTAQTKPNMESYNGPFSYGPSIYEEQVGFFKAPDTGRVVPTFETRYYGGYGSGTGLIENRAASQDETAYFKEQTNILQSSTVPYTKLGLATNEFIGGAKNEFSTGLNTITGYASASNKASSNFLINAGATKENIKTFSDIVTTPIGLVYKPGQEFVSDRITNLTTSFTDKPFSKGVEYALGLGYGTAVKGILKVTSLGFKAAGFTKAGVTATKYAGLGLNLGGKVLGSGYVASLGYDIASSKDIGTGTDKAIAAAWDIGTFAKGYKAGSSIFPGTKVADFNIGKAVSNKLGYPKYEVTFGQKTISTTNNEFGTFLKTQTKGTVKEINLFSSKKYNTDILANTRLEPITETIYKADTRGSGLTDNKAFGFRSSGVIENKPIAFTKDMGSFKVTQSKEGFTYGGTSQVSFVKSKATSYSLDAGAGVKFNQDFTGIYGKNYPVVRKGNSFNFLKGGRSTLVGLSKTTETPMFTEFKPEPPSSGLIGNYDLPKTTQGVKTEFKDLLASQEVVLKNIAVKTIPKAKVVSKSSEFTMKPYSSKGSQITSNTFSQGAYTGLGQYERTQSVSFKNSFSNKDMGLTNVGTLDLGLNKDMGIQNFGVTKTISGNKGRTITNSVSDIIQKQNVVNITVSKSRQDTKQVIKQSYVFEPFGGFSFLPITGKGFGGGFDTPSLGGFALPNIRTRGRKNTFNITPSFTGIVANIKQKGTLKLSKEFGLLPGQVRGVQTAKTSKAYYELVDF